MAATAVTDPATGITSSGATLNGTVNPDGTQAVAYFEYGPTTGYGTTTSPVDVGAGLSPVPVARSIGGLPSGTVRHYRVVLDTNVIPPPSFGASLPARIGASSGSTINVTTKAQLVAAIAAVVPDQIISINSNIAGGGTQLTVNCNGSAGNPITFTGSGILSGFTQIYVTGTYLRFLGLEVASCSLANFKLTDGANHVEIDGCQIYNSGRQGILTTASASNWQIWNCDIHDNGSTANGNLDHGIYAGYARGSCVIANCKAYNNCAYNIQVYPDSPNVILACNTVDDGQVHAGGRGGIVIGSNPGSPLTTSTINVGMLTTNAPTYGVSLYNPGAGNNTYDALGFGNGSGDFQTGSGMTYTHCTHADPDYVDQPGRDYHLNGGSPAIDYIDPARYGYIPPTDIDGTTRVTADAGCYAA